MRCRVLRSGGFRRFDGPAIAAEEMAFIEQAFERSQSARLVLAALHTTHGVDHVACRAERTATHFGFVAKSIAGDFGGDVVSAHGTIL